MTAAAQPHPRREGIDDLDWSFGDRLRKIRKRRTDNLGQREFAKQLGVGWQAYAQWEAENSQPRDVVAIAKRIEILTGVPAAWTLGVNAPSVSPGHHSDIHSEMPWFRSRYRSDGLLTGPPPQVNRLATVTSLIGARERRVSEQTGASVTAVG